MTLLFLCKQYIFSTYKSVIINVKFCQGRMVMKFISWNINGLKTCIDKGFKDFFHKTDADLFV